MPQWLDILLNGPARYTQEHNFSSGWALVFVVAALLIEFGVAYFLIFLLIKLLQYARTFFSFILRELGVGKREIERTFLQLTFPSDTTKSAYATEQLHILMRSMVKYYGFWERLAARKQPYSLELVATRDEGIRYIIMVPKDEVEVVKRTLLSFLPGLKITEVNDYLTKAGGVQASVAELKLTGDFVLPLADHKTLDEYDPVAYLTGHMRSLQPGELVAFQIVAVPVYKNTHPNELRHVRDTQHRIALNKEIAPKLTAHKIDMPRILLRIVLAPFWLIAMGAKIIGAVLEAIFAGKVPGDDDTKRRTGDPYEQELGAAIKTKLDQHLYEVSMRVLVASPDADTIDARLDSIVASFGTFTGTRQSISTRRALPFVSSADKWLARFWNRSLLCHVASQQTILSSSELADLYHFPNTDLTKTEGLVKSRSRELAALSTASSSHGRHDQFRFVASVYESS